jgi:hypothetical protein
VLALLQQMENFGGMDLFGALARLFDDLKVDLILITCQRCSFAVLDFAHLSHQSYCQPRERTTEQHK